MAERERAESPLHYESDDTDTISVVDTVVSDYEGREDEDWELEGIIGEASFDEVDENGDVHQVKRYLLKWKGYSIYRSTWETEENLVEGTPDTWLRWQEQKMRVARGLTKPFDTEQWEEEVAERTEHRIRRHERRNRRRQALGMPTVYYEGEQDYDQVEAPGESSDEEPVKALSRRTKQVHSDSDDDMPTTTTGRKKRRTRAAVERDEQKRIELLKRKKGTAVPVLKGNEKEEPQATVKKTVKTTTITAPAKSVAPQTGSNTSPQQRASASTTVATRVVQNPAFKPFASATRTKPVSVQVSTLRTTPADATAPKRAEAASQSARPAPMARMVGGPSRMGQSAKRPVVQTGTLSPLECDFSFFSSGESAFCMNRMALFHKRFHVEDLCAFT